MKSTTAVDDQFAPEPEQPSSGQSAALTFDDAVRIARGCTDYGGGYRGLPELFEAYQAGISTVVTALTAARDKGLADSQIRALHSMGAQPDAATPDEIEGLRAHVALLKSALAQAERENNELRAQAANAAPQIDDAIFLVCARLGLAGASDEEVLRYVRTALTTQGESHVD